MYGLVIFFQQKKIYEENDIILVNRFKFFICIVQSKSHKNTLTCHRTIKIS
jgi:hypothetical protein